MAGKIRSAGLRRIARRIEREQLEEMVDRERTQVCLAALGMTEEQQAAILARADANALITFRSAADWRSWYVRLAAFRTWPPGKTLDEWITEARGAFLLNAAMPGAQP